MAKWRESMCEEDRSMACWHCGTELIWGGDHDIEEDIDPDYSMVSNLSCPKCNSAVEVYYPREEPDDGSESDA